MNIVYPPSILQEYYAAYPRKYFYPLPPKYISNPNHILNSDPNLKLNLNTEPKVFDWRVTGGYFTHSLIIKS